MKRARAARAARTLGLGLGLGLVAMTAHAQSARPQEISRSRAEFRTGMAAARGEQWHQALDAFVRAYALAPQTVLLLHLANARVHTGRLVLGAQTYRQFLNEATEEPAARHRAAASQALALVEAQIPHVRVRLTNRAPDDRVALDEQPLPAGEVHEALALDPGVHVLEASRAGTVIAREVFELTEAQSREVTLALPPRTAAMRAAPALTLPTTHASVLAPTPHAPAQRPRLRASTHGTSPWVWAGVSAAAGILVAGAVVGVVLVTSGPAYTFQPGELTVH